MTARIERHALAPASAAEELSGRGSAVRRWSASPGERFAPHEHGERKLLVVLRGAISFAIGAEELDMVAGDLLDLPAHTMHRATVGPEGVECAETFVSDEPSTSRGQ